MSDLWFELYFGPSSKLPKNGDVKSGFAALCEALRWEGNNTEWIEFVVNNRDQLAGPPLHPVPMELSYEPAVLNAVRVALKLMAGSARSPLANPNGTSSEPTTLSGPATGHTHYGLTAVNLPKIAEELFSLADVAEN